MKKIDIYLLELLYKIIRYEKHKIYTLRTYFK